MPDIATLLADATQRLAALPQAEPRLEAELLLASAIAKARTHLRAWPERIPEPGQQQAFEAMLQRRLAGEPIAYILGRREFWSLELEVTPDTLIPRPETERLVELALELIPLNSPLRIADLGTGSGAIAAAVAQERPVARLVATDRSPAALDLARRNFRRLGLSNVEALPGSWCDALPPGERFDLILSNPPYIRDDDPHLGEGDLPREPRQALASGFDGLDDIRQIIAQAPAHLALGGWLVLEHGYDQGREVRALLLAANWGGVRTERDWAGMDRVTMGRWERP